MPFLGKAFNVDDTLFVWVAKHIVQYPTDPFGFTVVWSSHSELMWNVIKNPPGAAYLLALAGSWAGWSEHILHVEFLAVALIVVLAVYHLGLQMTRLPAIAALATLAAPGFLVSATSVMCDVPMLAIWLSAIISWRKGMREEKPLWLAYSGILIGVCALTKYFGASLVVLLLL
jgi:4-amino-4-deoxy-L-arabinose transferase-like glycosyltransferase